VAQYYFKTTYPIATGGLTSTGLVQGTGFRYPTAQQEIAANGTGVVVTSEDAGGVRRTVITLSDHSVAMVDVAGTIAYGKSKVADFDAGHLLFLGAVADLALTLDAAGVNADWDGDFGLGTAGAGADGDLTSTEQDLIPKTATPQASGSATTAKGASSTTESGVVFDGSATAKDVWFNVLVDDADHDVTTTPTNMILNGTIVLTYALLGDN